MEPCLLDSKACGRVALRIEVDQEGGALGQSQTCGKVHGGRGLPDAALLIHDRKDLCHPICRQSWASVPRRTL